MNGGMELKHKNLLKIIFDVVMILLFALLYDTSASGVAFHEIGGLVIFGFFLTHVLYNKKWVAQVTKRLFGKGLNARSRILYLLNVLLLVSFLLTGLSGIRISHVVFTGLEKAGDVWLRLHIASALAALLLVAVHLGLHWKFILGVLKKYGNIPAKWKTALGSVLVVLVIVAGAYGTATVSVSLVEKALPKQTQSLTQAGEQAGQNGEADHAPKGGENKGGGQGGNGAGPNAGAGKETENVTLTGFVTAGTLLLSTTLLFSLLTYAVEKLAKRKPKPGLPE